MIWKVLKKNIRVTQLTGAFVGVLCGLTLLGGAGIFYFDVKQVFEDKEGFWKDEYIVINKSIHLSDAYHQITERKETSTTFTQEEIEDIKKQDFANDVAPFTASNFTVRVFTDRDSPIPGFYSDLFFESVPDQYIDVNFEEWYWEEGMQFVPTILPRSYLNLYNFGFAQSQNLPQISEEGAGIISFNVVISGNDQRKEFETRIVGFSDRINTFLVPQSFIDWGNLNFGTNQNPQPGRLIVITNDPTNPEMMDYFEKHEYAVSKSLLSNTKALVFLRITTVIVLIIGITIIALAFWLMIVSILLLLERNNENISKLSLLGYSPKEISKPYVRLIFILLTSTYFVSFIPLVFLRNAYLPVLKSIGYETISTNLIFIFTAIFVFVFMLCVYLITYTKKMIRNAMVS